MNQHTQTFREDLKEFNEMTEKFYTKEISIKDYKGFSGGFGSYAQRGGEASMLRLRMPGGRLTKEKLKFVADAIAEHHISMVHFTTCQTIQLHNLSKESVCDLIDKAFDVGIITRGGGGDFPRNVMVSPLSGVEQGEYFDVLPYAEAVSDYLLSFIKTVQLPRKLKVCFSNSPANETHATFRDLGFVATPDGCFDVYSAGGLGNNPRLGVCVDTNVKPEDVLYYIKAMVKTFIAHGNYENRAKARTRYMQETLGTEGYKQAFLHELELVRSEENLPLSVNTAPIVKTGGGTIPVHPRIITQKQPGLCAVKYHPLGGIPSLSFFAALYDIIAPMPDVEVRIAPDETIYIINLTDTEAEKVLSVTDDGARNLLESSVSCIGSTICQIGLRDSQGLLNAIIEETRKYDFADGVLPRIHISGCTSSCGTHQIGVLGFHGGVKRIDDKPENTFTFHVNGSAHEGGERFGESWGMMLEREIPQFFVELGQAVAAENETFDTWYAKSPDKLRSIAGKYLH